MIVCSILLTGNALSSSKSAKRYLMIDLALLYMISMQLCEFVSYLKSAYNLILKWYLKRLPAIALTIVG